jgi:oligopeptidase B
MKHKLHRLLAALAASLIALGALAQSPAAPVAPREAKDVSVHGDARNDDYFWLRNRDDPRVMAHLKAEKAYADAWFEPLRPLQQKLYDEMLGRVVQDDEAVPYRRGNWWYSSRTKEGLAYPIYIRRAAVGPQRAFDAKAPEQVLFDMNAMAQGKKYLSMGDQAFSPDGWRVAYSTDETGGRDFVLRVRDLRTGKDLDWQVPEVSSTAWAADGRTLFYVTMDSAKRSNKLWLAQPGSNQPAVMVFEETNALFDIQVGTTRDKRYLVLESTSKDESVSRVINAYQPLAPWNTVLPLRKGVQYELEHRDGRFYVRINDTGPDFRVVSLDAYRPDLAKAQEVVAAAPGLMIEQVEVFRQHLVITERRQGLLTLHVRDLRPGLPAAKADHLVQFDEAAYTVRGLQNAEYDTNVFRYRYESLTTPGTVVDYRLDTRERTVRKQQVVKGGYDSTRYTSERFMATAPDGTAVPVSLVYRKDLRRNGPQPLLLYGYGSYGYPNDVTFSSARLSLLDRGVVFADAHIRGGGDLGRSWYEAGKMARKINSFTDFVAVADALVAKGYTSPGQLAIQGGSAGGLLMGAVVNLRPALFKAVVAEVPFVDVINTMLDETLPLTVSEFQEWGNPKLPEQYQWMRAYSPYDNLKAGAYPAMLLRTGVNDSQVPYWEPTKYAARLRTLKTDTNPLLLSVNLDAGHGGASGRYDALKEGAQVYTFLLQQWGLAQTVP